MLLVAILVAGAVGWALRGAVPPPSERPDRPRPGAEGPSSPAAAGEVEPASPLPLPAHVRALVVGGGPHPSANEVQLEGDLGLAREVLGDGGTVLLFAGGPGTRAVRLDAGAVAPRPPALLDALAALFATATSRGSTFRRTDLDVHGAATLARTLELLTLARSEPGGGPLLFYFAGHGDGGEAPEDATALFWGGDVLDPATLADELDAMAGGAPGPADAAARAAPALGAEGGEVGGEEVGASENAPSSPDGAPAEPAARRLRLVMTSCFSGGFADLVFSGADPARGPTPDDRCGFFATAWDLEASGCDADPDRARHEGYGVHFLHALRGRTRDGTDARARIDLDGDGTITLSEAHAHARIASRSIDVPTATSARLVRELGGALPPTRGAAPVMWPEEEAVRRALGEALDVADRREAERRESEAQARAVELESSREDTAAAEEDAWVELTSALLARWPVLDDPWHDDFARTLEREGPAIEAVLAASPAYAAWLEARETLERLDADDAALALELALVRRWLEADETLTLAARIAAARPEAWAAVLRVRACEASAP